ncbi:MAG TPA: TonB family protein, partial [Polyangiaceae bacterium]|nr:TonB family protein [Polyangiaceae bacterium]
MAQDAAAPGLEAVEPPELQQAVDPIYPEEALAQGIEGTVVLRLTIDVEGHVVEADVAESCGHGMDQAAQSAALGFRFTPARRGGRSVSARILYRVPFKLPVPGSTAPSAFTARVLDAGAPVPGLEVTVNGPGGARLRATTDADGRAPFAQLPAARYELQVTRGAQQTTRVVEASAGQELTVDLELPPLAPSRPALPPIEVTVLGSVTPADKLRHSAEAVTVVDTHKAKEQTADLGEVLARTQGVGIRRDAGLGSGSQFSLNGLHDEQVRFFLDGVPLSVAGFPFGIADMPVNLLDRVEIYRGVVPIRFGADALGGAVNLVSAGGRGSHASASYQVGSFGTHRVTAAGRYEDDRTGLYAGASAFLDIAQNDYDVDVQVTDDVGHLHDATV